MSSRARTAAAAAVAVALAATGCGAAPATRAPATHAPATHAPATHAPRMRIAARAPTSAPPRAVAAGVAQADRTGEYPVAGTRQTVLGGWRQPAQAVRVFADTYINWTATTVSAKLAALAQVSVGQARAIVSLAAGQTARDYELRHGGIANAGTVETVTGLPGAAGRYVVVTRETTTSTNSAAYRGLPPAWHVTIATVVAVDGGSLGRLWVLSGWQPQS